MTRWIAVGIWGAATALALTGATRASAQVADDGGFADAATTGGGATAQVGGMDAATVLAEGGAGDGGAGNGGAGGGDGGASDGGGAGRDDDASLREYDLLERGDGGRACSAGPDGTSNALSLALTLGLSTLVVRRRKRV